MNQIKLATTKYVCESFKKEAALIRKAQRREAAASLFTLVVCFSIFAGTIVVMAKNPEWLGVIKNYF